MRLRCSVCGAEQSLETVVNDVAARKALAEALSLSPHGLAIVAYLALHRPKKRSLSWRRVEALLGELNPAITSGVIRRRARDWPIHPDAWAPGFEAVLQARDNGKLALPLKSNAYLFETVISHSERLRGTAELRRDEEQRTSGARPAVAPDPAARYEALLAEAIRLGVERDAQGRVRRPDELAAAIREAHQQERSGE